MRSVLIFRIGSLGDTLVALPAMWAVRDHFRDARRLTLLCDHHPRHNYVLASDLLSGSNIVDDFMRYPVDNSRRGRLLMPLRITRLAARLRLRRYDTLVYLAPTLRTPRQVERDRVFFRTMAGIKDIIGMDHGFDEPPPPPPGALLPFEADRLLSRIAPRIPTPPPGAGRMDLALAPADHQHVDAWLKTQPRPDGGRLWIGLGPGSKMPAKIWPKERYLAVLRRLVSDFDVWPVVFGGPEDRPVGEWLVRELDRGYVAAGALALRPSAAGLARCRLYLGNDTGTMHMAAAVGVRCVAVFSARAHPGTWYPYGSGHYVCHTDIDCQGCGLIECVDRKMECVMRINTDDVYRACADVLAGARVPSP